MGSYDRVSHSRQFGVAVSDELLDASDLMKLQLSNDPLDDVSLCTLCSFTCQVTQLTQ